MEVALVLAARPLLEGLAEDSTEEEEALVEVELLDSAEVDFPPPLMLAVALQLEGLGEDSVAVDSVAEESYLVEVELVDLAEVDLAEVDLAEVDLVAPHRRLPPPLILRAAELNLGFLVTSRMISGLVTFFEMQWLEVMVDQASGVAKKSLLQALVDPGAPECPASLAQTYLRSSSRPLISFFFSYSSLVAPRLVISLSFRASAPLTHRRSLVMVAAVVGAELVEASALSAEVSEVVVVHFPGLEEEPSIRDSLRLRFLLLISPDSLLVK